jgi:hypothetical protein
MKKNKYWFKSKRFGWGFVPISWEGWGIVFLWVVMIVFGAYLSNMFSESVSGKDGFTFLFYISSLIIVSMPLHIKKCKDKPRWRWGK